MRSQADLLREPWNALIILDACRADALGSLAPGVETVRSLAWITYDWIRRFVPLFGQERLLYVSSNPVVERELARHKHNWQVRSVWRDGWRRSGPCAMPAVTAAETAFAVSQHLSVYGQPERMIVHFLQPHVPYVGDPGLPYSGWGGGMDDPLSVAVGEHTTVEAALARGLCTIEQVRLAYQANVELAVRYALPMASDWLKGKVVLTADHCELLALDGEPGYGHAKWDPKLYQVPWLAWDHGPFEPAPVPELIHPQDVDADVHAKLEALGYE